MTQTRRLDSSIKENVSRLLRLLVYGPRSSHFDALTKDSVTRFNVIIKLPDDSTHLLIGQLGLFSSLIGHFWVPGHIV